MACTVLAMGVYMAESRLGRFGRLLDELVVMASDPSMTTVDTQFKLRQIFDLAKSAETDLNDALTQLEARDQSIERLNDELTEARLVANALAKAVLGRDALADPKVLNG